MNNQSTKNYEEDGNENGPAFISLGVSALSAVLFVMLTIPMGIEFPNNSFEYSEGISEVLGFIPGDKKQENNYVNLHGLDMDDDFITKDYLMLSKPTNNTIVVSIGSDSIEPSQFTMSVNNALQVYFSDIGADRFGVDIYFSEADRKDKTYTEKIRQILILHNHLGTLGINISELRIRLHPKPQIQSQLVYVFKANDSRNGLIMQF